MRRFETDYAGTWRGHCKTRENAVIAAMRHIVNDGYTRCTITDKTTGEVVVRVHLSKNRKSAIVEAANQFKKLGEQT
jgi:hypothetical protein